MFPDTVLSFLTAEERRKTTQLRKRLRDECKSLGMRSWVAKLANRFHFPLQRIRPPFFDYIVVGSRIERVYREWVMPNFLLIGLSVEVAVDRGGALHFYLISNHRSLTEHKVAEIPVEKLDDWDFIIEVVERFRLVPV